MALSIAGAAWSGTVLANGAWSLEPEFAGDAEYSTNPQLRFADGRSGAAVVGNVGLPLHWEDGARTLDFAPRARVAAAGGDSAIGANALYLGAGTTLKGERDSADLHGQWADDSAAVREPTAGTLTRVNIRERTRTASGNWSYSVSERWNTTLSAVAQAFDYAKGARARAGLLDYRNSNIAAQISYALSERVKLEAVTSGSRYTVPDARYQQDTTSLQVGASGLIGDLVTCSMLVGRSRGQSQNGGPARSTAAYQGSLEHRGEKVSFSITGSDSIQPSGFNTLVKSREYGATAGWMASERLQYSLNYRHADTSSAFGQFTIADRSYRATSLGASWRASEVWDLRLSLNYQQQGQSRTLFELEEASHGLGASVGMARRFGRIHVS